MIFSVPIISFWNGPRFTSGKCGTDDLFYNALYWRGCIDSLVVQALICAFISGIFASFVSRCTMIWRFGEPRGLTLFFLFGERPLYFYIAHFGRCVGIKGEAFGDVEYYGRFSSVGDDEVLGISIVKFLRCFFCHPL